MKHPILILLLLLALPVAAQVPPPQVPLTGNIGPQGNFPLLNHGTINISGNYTMTYPDMSAEVIQFTGTLSATATITAPLKFGFDFLVQNATTGGQSIIIAGPTGTGVTIPNGQSMQVMCDGTNYVAIGAAGGGYNVPSNYSTVQAAINAAAAAHAGPVTVSPEAIDPTPFTNPSSVRVFDFRQTYNVDSIAARSVKEWGVKADAKIIYGNGIVTPGSTTITAPAGTFSPTDVGKDLICFACGDTHNGWAYPYSVASGGSGGQDGWRNIHMTGGGCTTEPTGSVQVTNGVPGGGVSPVLIGVGCTTPPNTGTVDTVTGTVTFNVGASVQPTDFITTIVRFTDDSHVVVAAPPLANGYDGAGGGVAIIWGTDDTNAWQAAANAAQGNGASNALGFGDLTFCGFSIISAPVVFAGWGGKLTGCGWGSFNGGYGAKLISADQTKGRAMLNLQNGLGARVERIHFFGNRVSMPIGVEITRDATAGVAGGYIGSYNQLSQLWFGPMYDGSPGGTTIINVPSLTSGIKANGIWGNADYNHMANLVIQNAGIAFDNINGNGTSWIWDQPLLFYNTIGFVVVGNQTINNGGAGGNGVDFLLGSPNIPSGQWAGTLDAPGWDSEGSSQFIAVASTGSAGAIMRFPKAGWQVTNRVVYSGKIIDFTGVLGNSSLSLGEKGGRFFWQYYNYSGTPALSIQLGYDNACPPSAYPFYMYDNLQMGSIPIIYQGSYYASCDAQVSSPVIRERDNNAGNMGTEEIRAFLTGADNGQITVPYRHDYLGPFSTRGAGFYAYRGRTPIQAFIVPVGTTGSTTYRYQFTCVSNNLESAAGPIFLTTGGNAVLSATNYNQLNYNHMNGCDYYGVYGDQGSGAILQLLSGGQPVRIPQAIPATDTGTYTKGTVGPPTTDQTGNLFAENKVMVADPGTFPNSLYYQIDFRNLGSFNAFSNANGFALTYLNGKWVGEFPGPPSAGIPNVLSAGANAVYGYNTIGANTYPVGQNNLDFQNSFRPTLDSVLNSIVYYVPAGVTGNAAAALYDSDGQLTSGPANDPRTLLCMGTPQPVVASAWNTFPMPAGCFISHGHDYWGAEIFDTTASVAYDGPIPGQQSCGSGPVTPFQFPHTLPSVSCGASTNAGSVYYNATSVLAWGPSYGASNPIPPNMLGTGATGTGANYLLDNGTWGAGSAVNSISFANVTSGTNNGQVMRVGTGSGLTPDLTGGAITANILGGAGTSGGVATGNSYAMPTTFVPGAYLQFTGTGLAWTVPAGGGSGSTAWSSLTAPTQDLSVNLANWRTVFTPNFSGDNSGGTAYAFQQTGTPGTATNYTILSTTSSTANVGPFTATNSGGNGVQIQGLSAGNNIRALGTSKFLGPVQLTGVASTNLAADPAGNIIASTPAYLQIIPNIAMNAATGPITLTCPGFSGGNCPFTAPSGQDTTYRVIVTLTQTTAGSGCSAPGSVQFWMGGYTDADSGYVIPLSAGILPGSALGTVAYTQNMNMGNGVNSNQNMFNLMPLTINVHAGSTIQWRIQQTVAVTCTSQQPIFTARVALLAGG